MKRFYDSGAQKRKKRATVKNANAKIRKLSSFFSSQTSSASMTNSATEPASVLVEEDVATSSVSTSAFTGN